MKFHVKTDTYLFEINTSTKMITLLYGDIPFDVLSENVERYGIENIRTKFEVSNNVDRDVKNLTFDEYIIRERGENFFKTSTSDMLTYGIASDKVITLETWFKDLYTEYTLLINDKSTPTATPTVTPTANKPHTATFAHWVTSTTQLDEFIDKTPSKIDSETSYDVSHLSPYIYDAKFDGDSFTLHVNSDCYHWCLAGEAIDPITILHKYEECMKPSEVYQMLCIDIDSDVYHRIYKGVTSDLKQVSVTLVNEKFGKLVGDLDSVNRLVHNDDGSIRLKLSNIKFYKV